jgi:hypothetical protein
MRLNIHLSTNSVWGVHTRGCDRDASELNLVHAVYAQVKELYPDAAVTVTIGPGSDSIEVHDSEVSEEDYWSFVADTKEDVYEEVYTLLEQREWVVAAEREEAPEDRTQ